MICYYKLIYYYDGYNIIKNKIRAKFTGERE